MRKSAKTRQFDNVVQNPKKKRGKKPKTQPKTAAAKSVKKVKGGY